MKGPPLLWRQSRVSFQTSFDSKQLKLEPKLEPKLVSALSETKRLFWLFRFYIETEILDVTVRLNRNKQKTNRNSLIGSIISHFLQNIRVFPFFLGFFDFFQLFRFFSVCFEPVCFGCFASILKQKVSMFRLNWNKQKTHPNSLKVSIFGYFSENGGLFRFVTKQFCLFRLFRYSFETPKQTEAFSFWFHETNLNKRETDLVSVCFGWNWNLFLFVSRTPYVSLDEGTKCYDATYLTVIHKKGDFFSSFL